MAIFTPRWLREEKSETPTDLTAKTAKTVSVGSVRGLVAHSRNSSHWPLLTMHSPAITLLGVCVGCRGLTANLTADRRCEVCARRKKPLMSRAEAQRLLAEERGGVGPVRKAADAVLEAARLLRQPGGSTG